MKAARRTTISNICSALLITTFTAVICLTGLSVNFIKLFSGPGLPEKSLGHMSDYYTALWAAKNEKDTELPEYITVLDIPRGIDRAKTAELIRNISLLSPKVLFIDEIYGYPETDDSLLISALNACEKVILPVGLDECGQLQRPYFYDSLTSTTFGLSSGKHDGCIRSFTPCENIDGSSYKNTCCIIAEDAGQDISDIYNKKSILINFMTLLFRDKDAIPASQFWNLNEEEWAMAKDRFENKVVFIGDTRDTEDYHLCAIGSQMSGMMIQANIVNMMLTGKLIREIPIWACYLICFMIAFFMITMRFNPFTKNKLLIMCITLAVTLFIFTMIGEFFFVKHLFYIDFTPYIVTVFASSILLDIIKNKKEKSHA